MFIIATIGLNSLTEDKLRKIILSGADILRYNFAYRNIGEHPEHIQMFERVKDELNSSIKLLIDFPTNKVRLGDFEGRLFTVRETTTLTLRTATYSHDCNEFLPVDMPKLGEKSYVNQLISIGDGEVVLEVTGIIDSETIQAKILNNGTIKYIKTFNNGQFIDDESYINTCKQLITSCDEFQPDYIAISYINEALNDKLKAELCLNERRYKTIIKIERDVVDADLEKICQDPTYAMILIDRGEMGVNMPFEKIGLVQKSTIKKAKTYKKPAIVSTQILDSTINNYIPNRADILNLTDMILDDVNGIVLCHETAVGTRPLYTISVAKKIINAVEEYKRQTIFNAGI